MYTPTLDKCDDYTHPCHCRLFPTKKVVIIIISIQNCNFLAFKNDRFIFRLCEGVVCV